MYLRTCNIAFDDITRGANLLKDHVEVLETEIENLEAEVRRLRDEVKDLQTVIDEQNN